MHAANSKKSRNGLSQPNTEANSRNVSTLLPSISPKNKGGQSIGRTIEANVNQELQLQYGIGVSNNSINIVNMDSI